MYAWVPICSPCAFGAIGPVSGRTWVRTMSAARAAPHPRASKSAQRAMCLFIFFNPLVDRDKLPRAPDRDVGIGDTDDRQASIADSLPATAARCGRYQQGECQAAPGKLTQ